MKEKLSDQRPLKLDQDVASILDKYEGIVANKMPRSLLPTREISHFIDIIPGASLPNKEEYKLTP